MCGMKAQQTELPIPDATIWMTRTAVAERLGVDPATVSRWVRFGILTVYSPQSGATETCQPLFWVVQVDEVEAARGKFAKAFRRGRAAA